MGATELNKRQWLFDGHEGDFAAIEAASIYGMMMMIAGQGRKDVSDDLGSEQQFFRSALHDLDTDVNVA